MFDATTKAEQYSERAFYEGRTLPVPLYAGSYGMGRLALSSALFRVGRGARSTGMTTLSTFRGGSISYDGPELRQDDATALMGLIHRCRKGLVDDCVGFNPYEFARSIGWEGDTGSIKRLKESLQRMMRGILSVETKGGSAGADIHLVGDFVRRSSTAWEVNLSARVVDLFLGGTTFLPIAERALLTDGMQTWLASFLRAQSDEDLFSIEDLHTFSGSAGSLKEFGRSLRDSTMPKLKEAGVVSEFAFSYGKLRVKLRARKE